jgi:hypothetical protein
VTSWRTTARYPTWNEHKTHPFNFNSPFLTTSCEILFSDSPSCRRDSDLKTARFCCSRQEFCNPALFCKQHRCNCRSHHPTPTVRPTNLIRDNKRRSSVVLLFLCAPKQGITNEMTMLRPCSNSKTVTIWSPQRLLSMGTPNIHLTKYPRRPDCSTLGFGTTPVTLLYELTVTFAFASVVRAQLQIQLWSVSLNQQVHPAFAWGSDFYYISCIHRSCTVISSR